MKYASVPRVTDPHPRRTSNPHNTRVVPGIPTNSQRLDLSRATSLQRTQRGDHPPSTRNYSLQLAEA